MGASLCVMAKELQISLRKTVGMFHFTGLCSEEKPWGKKTGIEARHKLLYYSPGKQDCLAITKYSDAVYFLKTAFLFSCKDRRLISLPKDYVNSAFLLTCTLPPV